MDLLWVCYQNLRPIWPLVQVGKDFRANEAIVCGFKNSEAFFGIIKIHVRWAAGRDLLAKRKTIQTWNFVHTLPQTIFKNGLFCFFEKVTPRTASLEKLLYYVDFPQISSIVFLKFKITVSMLLKHKNWKIKKLVVPREARSSCGFVARGGSIRKKGHFIVKKSKRNRIELALQLQILSIMKRRILRHCLKGKKS